MGGHAARDTAEGGDLDSGAGGAQGLVFTEPDGSPLHPADVTEHFQHLTRQAGLSPIRQHDLRHGAATLASAAGVEMNPSGVDPSSRARLGHR